MTAALTRWRLVFHQSDELFGCRTRRTHVSSIVLSADEATESLESQAQWHEACGWVVTRGVKVIVAHDGPVERLIEAREFDPLNDHPSRPPW